MNNMLYFNNNYFEDMNVYVYEPFSIPLSCEEVEHILIEGRSGTYTRKLGTYSDKEISMKLALIEEEFYQEQILEISQWLNDIQDNRLSGIYNDKCYLVKNVEFGTIKEELEGWGYFTVKFILEPFLVPHEENMIDITAIRDFYYYGTSEGEPLIKIYGSGNIQLEINGEIYQYDNVDERVDMDTKYMTVENALGEPVEYIGDFPCLIYGINKFKKIGNVTKLEILPRTAYR